MPEILNVFEGIEKIKDNVPDTINMIKEELRNTIYTNNDIVTTTYKQLVNN